MNVPFSSVKVYLQRMTSRMSTDLNRSLRRLFMPTETALLCEVYTIKENKSRKRPMALIPNRLLFYMN